MKLTLEPHIINGTPCKATFNLKVNFDDDLKLAQQSLGAWSFGAMCTYDLLVTARMRANAFIEKEGLKVHEDKTTVVGVNMIVYHDITPAQVANLLEAKPYILDEVALCELDKRYATANK